MSGDNIKQIWTPNGNRLKYTVGEVGVNAIFEVPSGVRVYLSDGTFHGYTWPQIGAYYGVVG